MSVSRMVEVTGWPCPHGMLGPPQQTGEEGVNGETKRSLEPRDVG